MTRAPARGQRAARAVHVPLPLLLVLACLGALVLYVFVHVSVAYVEVSQAKGDLAKARGRHVGVARAETLVQRAARRVHGARGVLADPIVQAVADLPLLGRPTRTVVVVTTATDGVLQAAATLLKQVGEHPEDTLLHDGAVQLGRVGQLADGLTQLLATVAVARADVHRLPPSYLPMVESSRRAFDTELRKVARPLAQADRAMRLVPEALGRSTTKRYLVVFQNPDEARGTGGLVGGFLLLEARAGRLVIVRHGPNTELTAYARGEQALTLPADFSDHYGYAQPGNAWINSNISPSFPDTARIWQALWKREDPRPIDGVVALDAVALADLLHATNGVRLSNGRLLTGDTAADYLLREQYSLYADQTQRKADLDQVISAVGSALLGAQAKPRQLVSAGRRAGQAHRLLVWSPDPAVQSLLAAAKVDGALPSSGFVMGDVVVDQAASKLGYYLDRTLLVRRSCDGHGTALLTLANHATRDLPDYVSNPALALPTRIERGDRADVVTLYGPPGSSLADPALDGRPLAFRRGTEHGLPWVEVTVVTPAGLSTRLEVRFSGAPTTPTVNWLRQAIVRPERLFAQPLRCRRG